MCKEIARVKFMGKYLVFRKIYELTHLAIDTHLAFRCEVNGILDRTARRVSALRGSGDRQYRCVPTIDIYLSLLHDYRCRDCLHFYCAIGFLKVLSQPNACCIIICIHFIICYYPCQQWLTGRYLKFLTIQDLLHIASVVMVVLSHFSGIVYIHFIFVYTGLWPGQ